MNKTRLLYRVTLAGSALLLAATATLSLLGTDLAPQIGLLALGTLGTFFASHLRLRMVLAGQRAVRRAAAMSSPRVGPIAATNPEVASLTTMENSADGIGTILTGIGDVQAAVAASESFLLAELSTIRQRLLAVDEHIQAGTPMESLQKSLESLAVTGGARHRWVEGQFQQIRTLLEQLPCDAGEYAVLRRLLIADDVAMPQLGGWAISSSTTTSMVRRVLEQGDVETIVELGSGSSTLWLASALRARGGVGHIHSLDHLREYGEKTRSLLAVHGLSGYATVHIAPLTTLDLGSESYDWYDLEVLPGDMSIDMLLVDGPPSGTNKKARYPAVPQFSDSLADGAFVYLDDTIRSGEKEIVSRWLAEFPSLAEAEKLPKTTVLRWSHAE